MRPTPAATGAKVRTTGTNLAIVTASGPKRVKKLSVRVTLFRLKTPDSRRSKILGPDLRPMVYPSLSPRAAETATRSKTS